MNTDETSHWQSQKRNISSLFVAATTIEDPRRQEAFGSLYSVMKIIDDLSDSMVETTTLTESDAESIRLNITQWKNRVKFCYHTVNDSSRIDLSLLKAITRFEIPEFLWVDFFRSQTMKLDVSGFKSIRELRKYAKGTAIVPITMFLLVICSEPDAHGIYRVANPDEIYAIGESVGTWSYILHTLLMEKAYLLDKVSRNLFPVDLMERHRVSIDELIRMARMETVDSDIQTMLAEYLKSGDLLGEIGRKNARAMLGKLPTDRRKALAVLISIYSEIQKRIIEMDYNIFSPEAIWEHQDRTELLRKVETYDTNFDLAVLW